MSGWDWGNLSVMEHQKALNERMENIEKISTAFITVDVFHSNNKIQEGWKKGCEVLINALIRRIDELENKYNKNKYCNNCGHKYE